MIKTVFFPTKPRPACSASERSSSGFVSTARIASRPPRTIRPVPKILEALLHHGVVIAAPRIAGDASEIGAGLFGEWALVITDRHCEDRHGRRKSGLRRQTFLGIAREIRHVGGETIVTPRFVGQLIPLAVGERRERDVVETKFVRDADDLSVDRTR